MWKKGKNVCLKEKRKKTKARRKRKRRNIDEARGKEKWRYKLNYKGRNIEKRKRNLQKNRLDFSMRLPIFKPKRTEMKLMQVILSRVTYTRF